MPEEAIVEADHTVEASPIQERRTAFNTMKDLLNQNLQPFFKEPPKPPEQAPAQNGTPEQPKTQETPNTPTTTQTPAASPDDDIPEVVRKSPKASEEFKKIRTSERQFKAEMEKHAAALKAAQEELVKLKSSPAPAPEEVQSLKKQYDDIKKQADAYSEQLKMVAIERHPNFKATFDSKTTTAIEKAKSVLGQEMIDKATKLAMTPPSDYRTKQLDEMVTELQESSPSKAQFLIQLVGDLNAVQYERESALKRANEDFDIVQRREREAQEAEQQKEVKRRGTLLSAALEASKNLEAFTRGQDVAFNDKVGEREKFVQSFFNGGVGDDFMAFVPGLAMEAAYLKETVIPDLKKQNSDLLQQIQDMTSSSPKPGLDNGKPSQNGSTTETPMAKATRILKEQLGRMGA